MATHKRGRTQAGDGRGSATTQAGSPNRAMLRRLLWYRERLQHQKTFRAADAMEALECSERTVLRDLDYARTLGWDLDYSRRQKSWVCEGGPLVLPVVNLTEGEALSLLIAERAAGAYAGTPLEPVLRSAFRKLQAALGDPISLDLGEMPAITFAGPPVREHDAEQFELLFRAVQGRHRVRVRYHSLERDEWNERELDPYHLFRHANGWYCACFCRLRGRVQTFALGKRMRDLRETGERFERDPEFDVDRYLAEGFGVFRGGEVETIVLRFEAEVARYVREVRWSPTEVKRELEGGGLELSFRAPVNVGVLRWVLQYGAAVEVVAPEILRQRVRGELRRGTAAYDAEESQG